MRTTQLFSVRAYFIVALLMPLFNLGLVQPAVAQSGPGFEDFEQKEDFYFQVGDTDNDGTEDTLQGNATEGGIALGERDPRQIIASIINIILGFLGLVAVVIILAGGFKWMTASGNQDKVDEAKKLIVSGIIGLVIILASFGIATFVFRALATATGAGGVE